MVVHSFPPFVSIEAWRNERVVFERPLGSSAPQMRGVAWRVVEKGCVRSLFNGGCHMIYHMIDISTIHNPSKFI